MSTNYLKTYPFNVMMDSLRSKVIRGMTREVMLSRMSPYSIEAALNTIEPNDRLIIELHYRDGKTYHQISEETNQSVGNVARKANKVITKLRSDEMVQLMQTVSMSEFRTLESRLSIIERENRTLHREMSIIEKKGNLPPAIKVRLGIGISLDESWLNTRTRNVLKRANFRSVEELFYFTRNDLKKIDGIGEKTVVQILHAISDHDIGNLPKTLGKGDIGLIVNPEIAVVLHRMGFHVIAQFIKESRRGVYNMLCRELNLTRMEMQRYGHEMNQINKALNDIACALMDLGIMSW